MVSGPVFTYQLRPDDPAVQVYASGAAPGATAAVTEQSLVKDVDARRMVVVSAAFPYREQFELFGKALRKERVEEFGPGDWPVFLGLNVMRWEVRADDKPGRWEWVYGAEEEGGRPVVKAKGLRALLNEAVYDDNPSRLAAVIVPGAPVTPLPQLANGDYPPLRLPGMAPAKKAVKGLPGLPTGPAAGVSVALPLPKGRPGLPGVPGVKGPVTLAVSLEWTSLTDLKAGTALAEQMAARLKGDVFPFDPAGLPPTSANARKIGLALTQPGKAAPPGKAKEEPGKGGKPAPLAKVPETCLVRFLDADVQPGKTYVYAVQVRLANPNYGKPDVVAYKQLAEVKELPAPWAFTPPVTVPGEWDFYVVDERVLEQFNRWWYPAAGSDVLAPAPNQIAVQIHKWFDRILDLNGSPHDLGEWLILERLLLYRGAVITRKGAAAEVSSWNKRVGRFQAATVPAFKTKGVSKGADFGPEQNEPPVVVDFTGGIMGSR